MTLSDQVCSLPLAQRLKELGVKQESLFYWEFDTWPDKRTTNTWTIQYGTNRSDVFSAFTVAELGEMLPDHVDLPENEAVTFFNQHKLGYYGNQGWQVRYGEIDDKKILNFIADTEADARAKMLAYLIENDLIKTA